MYSYVSRQATGLLFVTSICIHALLLCALLVSYHVQSVLLSKQLRQAMPLSQGSQKPAHVIFQQPKMSKPQPSITQNPLVKPAENNNSIALPIDTATTPANPITTRQEQATRKTSSVTTTAKTYANSKSRSLELPLSEKSDSIPTYHASSTNFSLRNKKAPVTSDIQKSIQKITLQDVAKSFFKSLEQEERMAASLRQPSTHDMVSKSYETKVFKIFQKSVSIESKPIKMSQGISTTAEVILTIDKKGTIIKFEFNHPLQKKDLKMVEDQLRRAAYSTGLYPSFPRIFTQDVYKLVLPLGIKVTKGIHFYTLTTNCHSI